MFDIGKLIIWNHLHKFYLEVELSDNKGQSRRNTQKLFVGNIADGTTDDELRYILEKLRSG